MPEPNTIHIVSCHAEGEVGDVITGGVPPPPGTTLWEQRDFLERTGQLASPPLLQQDARFVLSFREAPAGRYPFHLRGNRASGDGVVIVAVEEGR